MDDLHLAQQPSLGASEVYRLWDTNETSVQQALARNNIHDVQVIDERARRLPDPLRDQVLGQLALNTNLSTEAVRRLSTDESPYVRRKTTEREDALPSDVILALADDSDEEVRRHLVNRRDLAGDVLSLMAIQETSSLILRSIFEHPNTDRDTAIAVLADLPEADRERLMCASAQVDDDTFVEAVREQKRRTGAVPPAYKPRLAAIREAKAQAERDANAARRAQYVATSRVPRRNQPVQFGDDLMQRTAADTQSDEQTHSAIGSHAPGSTGDTHRRTLQFENRMAIEGQRAKASGLCGEITATTGRPCQNPVTEGRACHHHIGYATTRRY